MAEVNIPAELLDEAERFGLNVSGELTAFLRRRVAKAVKEQAWQEENRDAIDSWNEWVAKNGLPLGKHRQF